MAMLAEPRQRKRYNLVPRGKALYEGKTIYLLFLDLMLLIKTAQ